VSHLTSGFEAVEALENLYALAQATGATELDNWSIQIVEHYERRAPTPTEVERLTRRVAERIREFSDLLASDLHKSLSDDIMLRVDARHADFADKLGQDHTSEQLRDGAEARWERYVATRDSVEVWAPWSSPAPAELLNWLVPYVWMGEIRPAISDITRIECPAVSAVVLGTLQHAFMDGERTLADGRGEHVILDRKGRPVGVIKEPWPGPALPAGAAEVLRATQTLTAHRLIRFLLHQAHRQAIAHATPDFRCIRVAGGIAGLARLLGLNGRKACEEIKLALQVFQHTRVELPTGEIGGLLTWTTRNEAPGRPAELRIVVGDALLPHYVHALRKGSRTRQAARVLVPIPADLPPMVGHPRHHAGLARLQLLILAEVRHQATEMVRSGWIRIDGPRWSQLAEDAGVPAEVLSEAVRVWATAENAGAFLGQSAADPCLWKLTDSREKLFIEASGQQEESARLRQRRSRRSRAGRRAGQNSTRPRKPPAVEELNER
jgi:hypothetical protein